MAQGEGAVVPEITCQEVAQWASAYLEDHVGDARKRQIVLHLAICAGCETYVNQITTVRDVLGRLPELVEPQVDAGPLRQAFAVRTRRS